MLMSASKYGHNWQLFLVSINMQIIVLTRRLVYERK